MRFLADENVPFASVLRLRGEGHDVQVVPQGGTDSAILVLARDEQRVLLTFDRDFGRLVSTAVFLAEWRRLLPHATQLARFPCSDSPRAADPCRRCFRWSVHGR